MFSGNNHSYWGDLFLDTNVPRFFYTKKEENKIKWIIFLTNILYKNIHHGTGPITYFIIDYITC